MRSTVNWLLRLGGVFWLAQNVFPDESVVVETKLGKVRGSIKYVKESSKPVYSFRGLPYAEPPEGELRFRPPQPVKPWDDIHDATQFGTMCPQNMARTRAVFAPLLIPETGTAEDCLYLNIYTPSVQEEHKRPVMIFIHGGSLTIGSGNFYDGTVLAHSYDIVVVTMNYRLGSFGFYSTLDDNAPGNVGILDQRLVFTWVQHNIRQFGGDPASVTITGQSAGAASVSLHLLSPINIGLFHRAISFSGSCLIPGYTTPEPVPDSQVFADYLDCKSFDTTNMTDCIRTKSMDELLVAESKLLLISRKRFRITEDGDFLPRDPLSVYKREYHTVPYMAGLVTDEGFLLSKFITGNFLAGDINEKTVMDVVKTLLWFTVDENLDYVAQIVKDFYIYSSDLKSVPSMQQKLSDIVGHSVLTAPAIRAALFHAVSAATYLYEFHYRPSYSTKPQWLISDHTDELPFLFGDMFLSEPYYQDVLYSKEDFDASRLLMGYVANFVKSGSPNNETLPIWPVFTRSEQKYLIMKKDVEVGSFYKEDIRKFWNDRIYELIKPIQMTGLGEEEIFPIRDEL